MELWWILIFPCRDRVGGSVFFGPGQNAAIAPNLDISNLGFCRGFSRPLKSIYMRNNETTQQWKQRPPWLATRFFFNKNYLYWQDMIWETRAGFAPWQGVLVGPQALPPKVARFASCHRLSDYLAMYLIGEHAGQLLVWILTNWHLPSAMISSWRGAWKVGELGDGHGWRRCQPQLPPWVGFRFPSFYDGKSLCTKKKELWKNQRIDFCSPNNDSKWFWYVKWSHSNHSIDLINHVASKSCRCFKLSNSLEFKPILWKQHATFHHVYNHDWSVPHMHFQMIVTHYSYTNVFTGARNKYVELSTSRFPIFYI